MNRLLLAGALIAFSTPALAAPSWCDRPGLQECPAFAREKAAETQQAPPPPRAIPTQRPQVVLPAEPEPDEQHDCYVLGLSPTECGEYIRQLWRRH
jgi:hypothetical protein